MTSDTRVTMHKGAAALVAIALLTVGGGATYLLMRRDAGAGGQAADMALRTAAQPLPAAFAVPSNSPLSRMPSAIFLFRVASANRCARSGNSSCDCSGAPGARRWNLSNIDAFVRPTISCCCASKPARIPVHWASGGLTCRNCQQNKGWQRWPLRRKTVNDREGPGRAAPPLHREARVHCTG